MMACWLRTEFEQKLVSIKASDEDDRLAPLCALLVRRLVRRSFSEVGSLGEDECVLRGKYKSV